MIDKLDIDGETEEDPDAIRRGILTFYQYL